MDVEKAHYATTEPSDLTYRVLFNEDLVLECSQVVKLEEHYDGKDFDAVIYFPPAAVASLEMVRTDLSTHCPIKGDATYWSYRDITNGIWSYQDPLPQVESIRGHFAFNQGKGFRVAVSS